jgi:transcriptional regulator with XRE-family HTH domain/molybdate-binding protein
MAELDPHAAGDRLRRRRRAAGLSQIELAERAGVSRQAVGALEAGRHLPRVDAALALAAALGTNVEDLLGGAPTRGLHVLGLELVDGQPVRAARVGDHLVCVPLPSSGDGETWSAPNAVIRRGAVEPLDVAGPEGFVVVGCDPALGIMAALGPARGPGQLLAVAASSGAARLALTVGRAHAAIVHDVVPQEPEHADRVHRLALATWRTGLAAPAGRTRTLADAIAGRGEVVQREQGATAQVAYERVLDGAGAPHPPGPRATGHLDAARLALRTGAAAVTIEPVARALGLEFRPLEVHTVEVWIDAAATDHPGARALGELLTSARFRARLAAFDGYQLGGAA